MNTLPATLAEMSPVAFAELMAERFPQPEPVNERAARSPSIANLVAALATAQGAFPLIPRDRTVTVQPKPKRKPDGTEYWPQPYSFNYAPLATVLDKVRPQLAANGLALTQSVVPDGKGESVRTVLYHSSGEFLANETPLFVGSSDNQSQGYASGLTYARRYGVTTLLCLAADDDDDANGTDDDEADRQRMNAGRGGKGPNKPAPQREPVRQPEARKAADKGEAKAPPAADGAPLAAGPQRLLDAKMKAAGLTPEQVTERFGVVTMANLNATLAELSDLANKAAE